MKYLLRSIKYFVSMMVVLCLIIMALVAAKVVDGNISTMFVNGYDSLWQIALILAAISLLYPRFGYGSRDLHMGGGEYGPLREKLLHIMTAKGYCLEKEDGEQLSFVKKSAVIRAIRLCEDRLTFTRSLDGFTIEGPQRDLARVATALESADF